MISEIEPAAARGVPIYQIKITLKRSKPPIWRRVIVPANIKLNRLHEVIQISMGWENCHLHHFLIKGDFGDRTCFGVPDPNFGSDTLNEKNFTLAQLAPSAKQAFTYEYDFGDGWEHEITVEKILPPDPDFKHPVCLKGANACPPEDCGGMHGYYYLLAVLADPKHPEYNERQEWIGGPIDPTAFDLNRVNRRLKAVKV